MPCPRTRRRGGRAAAAERLVMGARTCAARPLSTCERRRISAHESICGRGKERGREGQETAAESAERRHRSRPLSSRLFYFLILLSLSLNGS
eukprot:scaffold174525_cov33-Tisochrysis_lutea.AAC.1